MDIISSEYCCPDMKTNINEFVQAGIHCIFSGNDERIPRPLSIALYGEKPKEVVDADILYMTPGVERDFKYVLIVKDDLRCYTSLRPCDNANSHAATTALGKYITCFGGMDWLVTGQGTQFKASLIKM